LSTNARTSSTWCLGVSSRSDQMEFTAAFISSWPLLITASSWPAFIAASVFC
jgi:hypothetical protein